MMDRNFALAYFMKENKCFPKGFNLQVFEGNFIGGIPEIFPDVTQKIDYFTV